MGHVRYYKPGDEHDLGPRLRQADLNEIHAATGRYPVDVLRESAESSAPSCTIIDNDGHIAGMFGCTAEGQVWLMGSKELVQNPLKRQFLRECRGYVDALPYPLLWNVIVARNTVHLRWLKWLGFTVSETPILYGPFHFPFYQFTRTK